MKFWKKIRKPGFIIGALLVMLLYAAGLFVRGLEAPAEYDFALRLHSRFSFFFGKILPKLPAVIASLLCALQLYWVSLKLKLSRPGTAAGIFLLLPFYFHVGTGASAIPLFVLGVLLICTGVFSIFCSRTVWSKIVWGVLTVIGVWFLWLLTRLVFYTPEVWFFVLLPAVALGCAALIELLHDHDRAVPLINAAARIFGTLCVIAGILVILPALARYFHFSYPRMLTFYQPKEHLYPVILALLIPLLWLHLCRTERKLAAKEAFFGTAVAFLLLLIPIVLPVSQRCNASPDFLIRRYRSELVKGSPLCWADPEMASAFTYETGLEATTLDYGKELFPASKLKSAIEEENRRGRDCIVALSSHRFDSALPGLPGVRYVSGKFIIIRYPGGVLK